MSPSRRILLASFLILCSVFGVVVGKAIAWSVEGAVPLVPPVGCSPSVDSASCKYDQYDPVNNPTPSGATAKIKLSCGGGNTGGCNFCLDLYGLRYESADGINFGLAPGSDQLNPAFTPAAYPMNCSSTQTVTNSVTFGLGPADPNATYYKLKLIMRVYFTPCPPNYSGPPDFIDSWTSAIFSY